MSTQYAPVVEAFHASNSIHAHVNGSEYKYEDTDGKQLTQEPTDKTGLLAFDGSNQLKQKFVNNAWQPYDVNSLTSFTDLIGLVATSKNLNFALETLSGDVDATNFNAFLTATVSDYFGMSHTINDYQEISSINNYVKTLQHDEYTRLTKLNDKFTNEVLSTKEMYLMANRDTYQIRSNIRLIMYALVTLAILMALMPSNDTVWAKVLMGLVIIAFFVYAVLHVRNDRGRRFKDFSKKFFSKGDLPDISKDAEAEKNKENENGETCNE